MDEDEKEIKRFLPKWYLEIKKKIKESNINI